MINRLSTAEKGFRSKLSELRDYSDSSDHEVSTTVSAIIAAVREHGDQALLEYTQRFDEHVVANAAEFALPAGRLHSALESLDPELRDALNLAAVRIRNFHERQVQHSWSVTEDDGTELGQRITPLERVGVYVPGGKAAYPSTVLMNVIPAKVAGVAEVIMVVPAPGGQLDDSVLAAAAIAGVDRVFCVGWGASHCGFGLRYTDHSQSRQDCWSGKYLCSHGETLGIWRGRHRYARRPVGNRYCLRRYDCSGMGCHGSVFSSRA